MSGGVASGVDGLELEDGDVGVDGGGFEAGVAEQLLDVADVGPVFEHVRGAGVAEEVAGPDGLDPGAVEDAPHPVANMVGAEAFAVAGDEEGVFADAGKQDGTDVVEIFAEPLEGAVADGDDAVFPVFAFADGEDAGLWIEVFIVEPDEFGAADAGGVEELQDGAVAETERVGDVGYGEDGADLLGAERAGKATGLFAGEFEFAGGVGFEHVGAAEPGEEGLEGGEPLALGADGERVAVGLAVVIEVPLVAFEDRLGDLFGAAQIALLRPAQEGAETPAVAVNGFLGVVALA